MKNFGQGETHENLTLSLEEKQFLLIVFRTAVINGKCAVSRCLPAGRRSMSYSKSSPTYINGQKK